MDPLVMPCVAYAVVTTFTPGPNNITSSALGMRLGYRKALPFLLGITAGFLAIILCTGLLTDLASRAYEGILPWLRWIGVAYMAWLIVSLFLPAKHGSEEGIVRNARFRDGLLLQLVNPKLILYGITIYSSFHVLLSDTVPRLAASSLILTLLGFASVSLWALVGFAFSAFLKSRAAMLAFNIVMALLLAYSAVSIALH